MAKEGEGLRRAYRVVLGRWGVDEYGNPPDLGMLNDLVEAAAKWGARLVSQEDEVPDGDRARYVSDMERMIEMRIARELWVRRPGE